MVASNLAAERRDAAPSGRMSLRVSPGDLKKLFDQVEKQGQIVGHATDSEDKTTAVLDTEATTLSGQWRTPAAFPLLQSSRADWGPIRET